METGNVSKRQLEKKTPKATNTCLLEYFIRIQEINISFCENVKAFQFPEGLIYIDMINNIRVI